MKEKDIKIKTLSNNDRDSVRSLLGRFKSSSLFLLSNMAQAGLQDGEERFQGYWLAITPADDPSSILAVAAHFWNHNILIQSPDHALIPPLLDALLHGSNRPLAGLIGPWEQCVVAVDHLGIELDRCPYASKEPLYELLIDDLIPPTQTVTTRCAQGEDADIIAAWLQRSEALLYDEPHPLPYHRKHAQRLITSQHVWIAHHPTTHLPCAMTNVNAHLPEDRIFQIGGVFTPEEARRQGYARQVVARQLLDMRARGYTHAILFTGADNLPAQRAYLALGFRHILDYGLILGIPHDARV